MSERAFVFLTGVLLFALSPPSVCAGASDKEPSVPSSPDASAVSTIPDGRKEPRRARRFLEQALERARREGDLLTVTDLLGDLVDVRIDAGDYEVALRLAEESLAAARKSGDRRREAWALGAHGDARFYLGDLAGALQDYRTAQTIMRDLGDRHGQAVALKDIGIVYKYQGLYEEALTALDEAREILLAIGDLHDKCSILCNVGGAYEFLGDNARALASYEDALALALAAGSEWEEHHSRIRMGSLYLGSGMPEKALESLEPALAIAERLELLPQQAWALSGIVRALSALGRFDEAMQAQQRALGLSLRIGGDWLLAMRFHDLGVIYLQRDPAAAVDCFQRAAATFEKAGTPVRWPVRYDLGVAYHRTGDLDRAVESFLLAIQELESLRGGILSEAHRATYSGTHQSVYRELIEALFERHETSRSNTDLVTAFEVSERARARGLVEAITEARLEAGWPLDPELREREQRINTRIAKLQQEIARAGGSGRKRKELLEELEHAEDEFVRFLVELRRRDPRYASVLHPQPLSVEKAQALLDRKTALVVYCDTGRSLFVFVVAAQRFEALRLDTAPADVARRVANYLELIARPDESGWRDVARRLSVDLVQPVRALLPEEVEHLIIVPDGALHFLPFETVIHPAAAKDVSRAEERYLLEDFAISYVPSATALAHLRAQPEEGAPADRADLLMFANPVPPSSFERSGPRPAELARTRELYEDEGLEIPPLPYSVDEARAVRRMAGPGSEVFVGAEASEERLKARPLNRFRMIHFATHGLVSQRWPARSALLLAQDERETEDGLLQAREIYRMRLSSDLVILSACRTARGRILSGEGVQGLAQSFLYAGARSVLASLWSVEDDQTAAFMERFYEGLSAGRSKEEALRQAKLAMLRRAPTAPPRYWAPFILIGSSSETIPLAGRVWWQSAGPWLGLSLGLLLLLAKFVRGRRLTARALHAPPDVSRTTRAGAP